LMSSASSCSLSASIIGQTSAIGSLFIFRESSYGKPCRQAGNQVALVPPKAQVIQSILQIVDGNPCPVDATRLASISTGKQ
jgi:hypothetical protein